jgi:hypothetical protein
MDAPTSTRAGPAAATVAVARRCLLAASLAGGSTPTRCLLAASLAGGSTPTRRSASLAASTGSSSTASATIR